MSSTLVILLVGSTVAASCALVGTFLVLRRMALLGDAISHAVLPGIVIAFLLTGQRAPLPMLSAMRRSSPLRRTGSVWCSAPISVAWRRLSKRFVNALQGTSNRT